MDESNRNWNLNNNETDFENEKDLSTATVQERRQHFETLFLEIRQDSRCGRSSETSHRKTIGDLPKIEESSETQSDWEDFSDFDTSDFEDDEIPATSQEEIKPSQLDYLVDEVIKTQNTYINTLQRGIGGYLTVFEGQVPATLIGRKNTILGNLIKIFDFHSKIFLPKLKKRSGDIEKISRLFHRYIAEDYFYIYVHYAMNIWKARNICRDHEEFFARCKEDIGDRLGILSLLVQPLQRVPRYKLLFENILEELGKQVEASPEVKSQLVATSKAWKALDKLATCVNASVNVKDITDCYEISLPHQGKFRDFEAFDFYDNETSRRFKGHVFLFEKCIVFTENKHNSEQNRFIYRGHYAFAKLGVLQDINHGKLSLFRDRLGQQQLDIFGPTPAISKWNDRITKILITQLKQDNSNDKVRFTWHGTTEMNAWWSDTQ